MCRKWKPSSTHFGSCRNQKRYWLRLEKVYIDIRHYFDLVLPRISLKLRRDGFGPKILQLTVNKSRVSKGDTCFGDLVGSG